MKKKLMHTAFLAVLVMLVAAGCSAPEVTPTPVATPTAEQPSAPQGPDLAGGGYEDAAYQFFHWKEGLSVMVWHDAVQSSICSSGESTGQVASGVECQAVSRDGQIFVWQIDSSDGLSGTLTFNDVGYDLSAGNVFTIALTQEPVLVQQYQRDLSGVSVEWESITSFALSDSDLTAFIKYAGWKSYGSEFGLGFRFPSAWFGPEEYLSDQHLRVEIGSDVVYPYGTSRELQIYEVKDSYYVVVEYIKSDQVKAWDETYQALLGMQDGESLSGPRSLIIRVRQVSLGEFSGFEYIATLSETAQTEIVYIREIVLVDAQSNVLRIMGTPNNVEVAEGSTWREAWSAVDEANLETFHQIFDSVVIK